MDNVTKLNEIALRLDHIESSGEWLSRSLEDVDRAASKTGELIMALTEDVRARLLELVTELEKEIVISMRSH